jgi:DNA-binding MurR/RpiR family transcriptional regulator
VNKAERAKLPETYEALKGEIALGYKDFSKQLQKIARFSLESPNTLALETIATIAEQTGVQPSSMIRFAKAMGYDGFSDMQRVFRTHLISQSHSYQERIDSIRQPQMSSSQIYSQTLEEFVVEGCQALNLLREHTQEKSLNQAVSLLANAENIYVLAQKRAFPVAFYIHYALGRLGQHSHLVDNIGGTLLQQANMTTDKDVLIAISFPPYTPVVLEAVKNCREHDTSVIAITDTIVSPIALDSSLTFEILQQGDQAFRSLVAPMCLAQSLVLCLGHSLAAKRNGLTNHDK